MQSRAVLLVLAALTGAAACSTESYAVRSTGTRRVHHAAVRGTHVPAGTNFFVALDTPVDTQTSRVGQPVSAHLVAPLVASDGTVIAPAGARVTGRIAEVDSGRRPLLRIGFETIQVGDRVEPIAVKIEGAERDIYRTRSRVAQPVASSNFGEAVYEPTHGAYFRNDMGSTQGGYPQASYYRFPPRHVRIEQGAQIRLELTRPVLGPGATIVDDR